MPFEKGNTLGAKSKLFLHELEKAVAQGPDRLRKIAEKLLDRAEQGDMFAIREVADRLDGKATQTLNATVEHRLDVGGSESLAAKIQSALDARTRPTVQ